NQRKENLRCVMDAYVLGAVPPYSNLLGGKLVCTLLTASEVRDAYKKKYSAMKSVISERVHNNNLLLLTTTSALGKSSLYDRVKIGERTYFQSVGVTEGYGHFHIPQTIFNKMRQLLTLIEHPYAKNNRFGHGPNWRMRVIRVAFQECGFNPRLLKHQIKRESFMIPLAEYTRECLRQERKRPSFYKGDVESISKLAKERWLIPRSIRRPEYASFRREEFLESIVGMM
ncbi:MAG: DUF4338 domain-containing protein, partial [Candidatus Thorarchaeota archaeon]|nr:DUF4338 domain-containing protein [Candidatus Thorarchaeota archaeon]